MPFSVTGTYTLNESTWTDQLVYEDNNGAQIPIASPAVNIGVSSFSFTNPGLPAGNHTVTVKDPLTGNSVTSNTFVVSPAQAITANTPSGAVAGTSFNFTGTLTSFSTAPTLTYSLNSGAAVTMTGVTSSGWTTPITIATAGSYTLQVTNGSITSNTVTFTVAPVTVNHVITPTTPTGVTAGANFTFTGSLSGYSTAPSLTYSISGGTAVAMTGVTTVNWSMVIAAPATAGNYTIVVTDGTTSSSSIPFTVAAPPKVITPLTPSGVKAGVSFTFQGTLSGYTTLPALTYQVSGGTATTLNGTSLTGWATTVTIATVGTYTITVSDGTNTGTTQSFTVTLVSTATRSFMTNPGGNGTFWVSPFATTASWITSGSLVTMVRNGNGGSNVPLGYLHSPVTEKVAPFWIAASTDPVWTVTDGTMSIQVHLPVGAYAQGLDSGDNSIGGCDPSNPYRIWCINVATMNTTTNTITGYLLSIEDASGQYFVNAVTGQLGYNNTGGLLSDYDLTQLNASSSYVIPHMLACDFDPGMVSQTVVWPLVQPDPNGTGSVLPQGLTLGIPASTARPTGMSRGQAALFDQAQQYGWFMYNLSSNGCTTLNGSFPYSSSNTALLNDISNNMSWVMQYMCILNYNTVTGGQYSLATAKGMASGGTPAFTSPPPLDLSPTGGANIPPDTFGAWYSSQNGNTISPTGTFNGVTTNYNVTPTNTNPGGGTTKTITPNSPSGTIAGTSFTFTGSLAGYSAAPTLTYKIDNGTSVTMTGVTATGWSMSVTVGTSGSHTIVVTDAVNTITGSAQFTTSATAPSNQVTWSTTDLAGGITLSNNNYTATSTGSTGAGATPQSVRATQGITSTAPVVWEVQFTSLTQNVNAGVADASYVLTSGGQVGSDQHGIGAYPSTGTGSQPAQTVYFNNQQLTAGNGTSSSAGDIMTLAVNGTNFFFSDAAMRTTSGVNWNNSTTADPVSNTGGFSFSGMGTPYYPIFNDSEGGAVGILNDGTKAFSTFLANYIAANPSVVTLSGQASSSQKKITPASPSGVVSGVPFTFTGTLTGYSTAPTLTYSLNNGASSALGGVTSSGWSTSITSNVTGSNTLSVTDGTVTGSTTFTVSATGSTGGVTKAQMMSWLTGLVNKGSMPVQQLHGQTGDLSGVNTVASTSGMNVAGVGLNYYNNDASQPAVGGYAINTSAPNTAGISWWNAGGIVLVSGLNWPNPSGANGLGPAQAGPIDGNALITPGSTVYNAWHSILDSVAVGIKALIAAGVVPMLRPLHESNLNGSWWWDQSGLTDAQYVAVWQDMWNYYTNTYGFTNLIWIFAENGGNHLPNRYPGDAYVDLTGCDDYTNTPGNDVSTMISQQGYHNKPQGWCEWGGNPTPVSNTVIVNALRNTSLIYWEQWDTPWNISNNPDISVMMNDSWTLTRERISRPTSSAPLITGVTFTPASSILSNSAVGTVAGTLTAASSNGALTGVTFSLNSTTNFKIVSPNVIQFNSSTVAANTYPLTVTVSATNASNSPQGYSINIVVAAAGTSATRINNFLNIIGVCGQIQSYGAGAAYTNTTGIVADTAYIGARLWRDGTVASTSGAQLSAITALANAGKKFTIIPTNNGNGNTYTPVISTLLTQLTTINNAGPGNTLAYIEGPNEPDGFPLIYNGQTGGGTGTWVPVANFQSAYYTALKGSALSGVSIASCTNTGEQTSDTGLQWPTVPSGAASSAPAGTEFFQVYNSHVYPYYNGAVGFIDPSSAPLSTPRGNHDQFIEILDQDFGNPGLHGYVGNDAQAFAGPKIVSEFGLSTQQGSISDVVRAKNICNGYLNAYTDGYSAAFVYELYDEGDGYGICSGTGSYTNVATYMHNLTTALADTGSNAATFTPGSLSYTLSGMPSTALSYLFQNSNGTFLLAIWNNTTNWNYSSGTAITIGATAVTVNINGATRNVQVFDTTSSGTTPISNATAVSSVTISLIDYPIIVAIT